ncbi:Protein of unknown function DUF1395 domain-containing protein [Rozella allomycis CSF55]|uniref:Spindle and kinetochore-associated protein 1 n=1 Tax=Rozella allomycis (strain CSF55) TaxID=988480 RepID=A0A075AQ52_ROZAC|nr:Protein of unknown function DUF1395 domain-containing protein [Rozella allomycis CSF55]|eukprot:EPZ32270.1 Protein of unknown function DUF1395 domain-containing protein [Rozella allomycis CSF55]
MNEILERLDKRIETCQLSALYEILKLHQGNLDDHQKTMFQNQIQRYEEIQIASMKLKEQFDEEFRYKEMIKNLKAKMVRQQERMEYVLENIPKHIGNELKQHTLPKDAVAEKGKNIPRKVTSSKPMSINVPYVNIKEFDSIPKYMIKGKMTREKLNEYIQDLNSLIHDKQKILTTPVGKMNALQRQKYWDHKDAELDNLRNTFYFTEKDIQTWDLKVFKLDSMGRSVLNILRSLKRFREVRGNNHLRFVLLLNE